MKIARDGSTITLGKVRLTPSSALYIGPKVIDWPGEYQCDGFSVHAFDAGEHGLAFAVSADGMRSFFPARRPLFGEETDFDVLFLTAETSDFTPKEWKVFVENAEPRMVIFVGEGEKTTAAKREMGLSPTDCQPLSDLDPKKFVAEKTLFFTL